MQAQVAYSAIKAAARSAITHIRDQLRRPRLAGTFAPLRRASESPMAMACLGLVTFLPEAPDRSSPRFISCSARPTLRLLVLL